MTRSTVASAVQDQSCVVFVDEENLRRVGDLHRRAPIVAVLDMPLPKAVAYLERYPWLEHVISANSFDGPNPTYLLALVCRIATGGAMDLATLSAATVVGREAKLVRARQRAQRLERLGEFLNGHGFGGRSAVTAVDLAEEMLSNAFYDAPADAGIVSRPVSRLHDIVLPVPCEIAYGVKEGTALVRVRDHFGSLQRRRMVEVLRRCAREDMGVRPDDSRGGAGLGLWRIFSTSSFVSLAVHAGRLTEVIVGIHRRTPRGASGYRPYAFHLHFNGSDAPSSFLDDGLDADVSITLVV